MKDFPGHVRHLHADDDYRFSEEYKVRTYVRIYVHIPMYI